MLRFQRVPASLRWILGAVFGLAYAWVSHTLMTSTRDSALAMLIVLGPLVSMGVVGLWASGRRALACACAMVAALLGALAYRGQGLSSQWLYLAQHAGIHLCLALWFGATLRRGRQPLISALAQRLHGELTAALAGYTRRVTQAWVAYFIGMSLASLGLFAAGDFRHWSLLANVFTPLAMAVMFVGEYLLRYRLHPEFERVSLMRAVHAYQAHVEERKGEAAGRANP